jgi:hypothetical protein
MAFTGKATYSAGSTLPEIAEDVSNLISIVSPYETPLLNHLGDSPRPATSTYHEWLEEGVRKGNWTQIFTAAVSVSDSDLALRKLALSDELDYQKQERVRELLRDLENTVVNGIGGSMRASYPV